MRLVLAAPFLLQLACVPQSQPPSGKDASAPDAAGVDAGLPDAAVAPSVVVATFNVRRFFDPVCESGSCAPEDYEALPTQQQFLAKADQLAAALRELNADVVMLQEIETQLCLDALQSALDGGYPVAILGETGASASVDVAVLARGDWLESRRHRGMPLLRADGGATVFSRELLEIHLQRDGVRVVAFAAHFRSKSNDDPERRLLEAQVSHAVIRAKIDQLTVNHRLRRHTALQRIGPHGLASGRVHRMEMPVRCPHQHQPGGNVKSRRGQLTLVPRAALGDSVQHTLHVGFRRRQLRHVKRRIDRARPRVRTACGLADGLGPFPWGLLNDALLVFLKRQRTHEQRARDSNQRARREPALTAAE